MSSTQTFDDGWFRPSRPARGAATSGPREQQFPGGRRGRGRFRGSRRREFPFATLVDDNSEQRRGGHHDRHGGEQRGGEQRGEHPGRGGRGMGRPEFGLGGGPFGFGGPFGPFGQFGPGRGSGRGRGNRARRGDIRAAALVLLSEEPRNGYQIIQELANRSDGAWRASPGSVYPALQQLEDEGLIAATSGEGQKRWQLTDAGRAYVEENREKLGTPWETVGAGVPGGVRELAELGLQVGSALHQVVRAGNEAQVAKAAKILTDTRRALYRVLAEDDEPVS